ncbi:MAG: PAS domain S-box protein [Chloroherpetonaceae bacterium]
MKRGKSTPVSSGRVSKSSQSEKLPETAASKSHWQLAFEHMSQAVVVKNQNREVVEANLAFYRLTGVKPSEVIGKQFEDVLPLSEKSQRKQIEAEFKKRKEGVASEYEVQIGEGASAKTLRVQATPLFDEKQTFLGSVAILTEVKKSVVASPSDAEAFLRAVYNSADIGMCVTDAEGKFVEVNPAYCRTYGYTREELVGHHFSKVLPPEIREYAKKLHDDYIAEGTDQSAGEWQVMHKNGNIRDIAVTAARLILDDGRRFKVTTVTDITERKWVERQLRYQANLLQQVSEAIISVDNNFRITSWNKAAEMMYGWKENEVVGKHVHQVMPTKYLNETSDEVALTILQTTGEWIGEVVQPKKDGTEMIVHSSVSLLYDADGKVIGTVAINRDITAQKAVEQERIELYEQLQQLQKMEAIGTLSGGIAHDFNNILAAILGNANLIFEKTTDEKAKRYAERIKTAAERGAALTKQLLGFARKGKMEVAPVDLMQSVRNVVEMLEHSTDKRIQIRIESIGKIQKVLGDKNQLEQVILNLAVNAIDAIMPTLEEKHGGMLSFTLKMEKTNENQDARRSYLHLAISDSGTGIPKEIQNKIFEPFFTTKEVGKGTGLGLAMAYGIVRNHHGKIEIDSEVGRGTTVHVYLPVVQTSDEQKRQITAEEKHHTQLSSNKKVLIVDDEEMLRDLLVENLVEAGYTVYEASDGIEAIEMLKHLDAQQIRIDAVVLDMNMPRMNGAKAFAEIRMMFPSMPVLVATGFAQDEVVQKLLESGANGILSKPYNTKELLEKLDEILKA